MIDPIQSNTLDCNFDVKLRHLYYTQVSCGGPIYQ